MTRATASVLSIATAISLFCCSAALAQGRNEAASIPPGIYGNVEFIKHTGDLGGMEIEILPGTDPLLDVTICSSWCEQSFRVAYRNFAGVIYFDIPGDTEDSPQRFRMSKKGNNILVEGDGQFEVYKFRLKPLKQRFGLDVANDK